MKLYVHSKVRDDLEYMTALAPELQRVGVRAVIFRGWPVLYPALHWLPKEIFWSEVIRLAEEGGRDLFTQVAQSGIRYSPADHSMVDAFFMFGLLNVRVYLNNADTAKCCAQIAELSVDLSIDGEDVRRVRLAVHETDPGGVLRYQSARRGAQGGVGSAFPRGTARHGHLGVDRGWVCAE